MGHYQVLPLLVKIDLEVMATKVNSTFPKVKPPHLIVFFHIRDTIMIDFLKLGK